MPDSEFEIEQIGEVYARALLNLARQDNALDEITEDLRGIGELMKTNAGFAQLMTAVTLSPEEHYAILEKIFGGRVHRLTLETLKAMARRSRLMFLGGLAEGFVSLLKSASGRIDVEVISAAELSAQTLGRLTDAVGRATGKTPDLTVTQNPAIIGGVQVRVGDTLIDASVESQLQKMKEKLLRGGAQNRAAAVTNA